MGSRFLIDTNILIYVLTQALSDRLAEKINRIFQDSFIISVINKIEFLGWKNAGSDQHLQAHPTLLLRRLDRNHANPLILKIRSRTKMIEMRL
ncbi:MAG: hypothetical protein BWK80_57630 [Desulfobacteraceae bacterium IS3]|nr:MAG: hypothetical protein BWK80_57630 [Desulfobacteraceae bacterium IS3]